MVVVLSALEEVVSLKGAYFVIFYSLICFVYSKKPTYAEFFPLLFT